MKELLMAETESFQFNIGVLRSQMTLQIHTRQAARLWYGRKPTEERHGIIGMGGFLALTNRINIGSKMDDPYSDLWMLRIEEKIDQTKELLRVLHEEVDQVFMSVPPTFKMSENLNVQPANLPVFAGSHLGYLAIYVLAQYDEIVRKTMLAAHIALIDHIARDHWLERGDHYLRSLFTLANRYWYSGTTRKDFLEESAAALAAIEKYGEVPPDIMDGTRRSRFSPPLNVLPPDDPLQGEDLADEELFDEATLTVIVPAESELGVLPQNEAEVIADETQNTSHDSSEEEESSEEGDA